MSVMHCGDVGCPCRNLPPTADDTAALRAEVARLRAVVGKVRAVQICCSEWGCACTDHIRAALDGDAP